MSERDFHAEAIKILAKKLKMSEYAVKTDRGIQLRIAVHECESRLIMAHELLTTRQELAALQNEWLLLRSRKDRFEGVVFTVTIERDPRTGKRKVCSKVTK